MYYCTITNVLFSNSIFDPVEHKNMQLGLYLDAIQYNSQEKIGILPYVLENPEGIFLEIGTGGDPISNMLTMIPKGSNVTIIASDVDISVLNSLLIRHPELYSYIEEQAKPKLQLQQLNAIDMSVFEDNYLSGINASAIVHEIISYAGGFNAASLFFKESCRTLKPGGIVVYRDPEPINNKEELITTSLTTKSLKLFAHIFLYKFLDFRGSLLAKSNKKFCLYSPYSIKFDIYKKNEKTPIRLNYDEYLQIPSYDIDFSRDYKIEIPAGLNRELLRHYLTYMHCCNPLIFVKAIPNIINQTYSVTYYAHSTALILKKFLQKYNYELKDDIISLNQKLIIDSEIEQNHQVLEFGIPLQLENKKIQIQLRTILQNAGLNPSSHIIAVDHNKYLLDYRVFGMFFDQIYTLFDNKNNVINPDNIKHAVWLKREGEESYCYYSLDELITNVLISTYESFDKTGMVLCPIFNKNYFIERWCYTELLKEICCVQDIFGYKQNIFDGKRIIHFQKMPIHEALSICNSFINSDPSNYTLLNQAVQDIQKDKICKMNC